LPSWAAICWRRRLGTGNQAPGCRGRPGAFLTLQLTDKPLSVRRCAAVLAVLVVLAWLL